MSASCLYQSSMQTVSVLKLLQYVSVVASTICFGFGFVSVETVIYFLVPTVEVGLYLTLISHKS